MCKKGLTAQNVPPRMWSNISDTESHSGTYIDTI